MELNTEQINKYQKECIERTGCVMCAKSLQEEEVYACEECVSENYVEVNVVEAKE